ncbi:HMCN [Mytilus coruscus]|uniref:HMCN n=1 Tax=Mytilus coruscus TaxID=42192 RepID=A0A6J8A7R9_MYTCO|nr:HMCN [Mytilus coruscus]
MFRNNGKSTKGRNYEGKHNANRRCLEGVRLTSPLDTNIVTECGDHEICSVERYVTNDGLILFNVGCEDRQLCARNNPSIVRPIIGNPLVGKRDSTIICHHCCDDKDLCNMNMCGVAVRLPMGSNICYDCPLAMDANKCNHISLCDQDSQCAQIAQSNPQGICSFCCDTNLCNRNCTIKSTIAPPTTTTTTTTTTIAPTTPIPQTAPIVQHFNQHPTSIKYGDTVSIQCIVSGNPYPTIDFMVKGRRLGTNVAVDATTHVLTITNFLPYDDGDYRCIATNALGDDHKDFHLQGHY